MNEGRVQWDREVQSDSETEEENMQYEGVKKRRNASTMCALSVKCSHVKPNDN